MSLAQKSMEPGLEEITQQTGKGMEILTVSSQGVAKGWNEALEGWRGTTKKALLLEF